MRRAITLILAVLLLLLQYPLWLGKGGWLKVWDMSRQVEAQQQVNQQTRSRNALLDIEVRDLKQGTEAVWIHRKPPSRSASRFHPMCWCGRIR